MRAKLFVGSALAVVLAVAGIAFAGAFTKAKQTETVTATQPVAETPVAKVKGYVCCDLCAEVCPECCADCTEDQCSDECIACCIAMGCSDCCVPATKAVKAETPKTVTSAPAKKTGCCDGCCKDGCK